MKPLLLRLNAFRSQLTSLSAEEPLSKLSLVVILITDLVLLSVLFDGLATHRNQLISPRESVPPLCQEVFVTQRWEADNRLDRLQRWLRREYIDVPYQRRIEAIEARKQQRMIPTCRTLYQQVQQIGDEEPLLAQFRERIALQQKKARLSEAFARDKAVTDTRALEKLANGGQGPADSAIARQLAENEAELEQTTNVLRQLDKQLNRQPRIAALWQSLAQAPPGLREQLIEQGRQARFWYPLKTLLWEAVFIGPLLLVSYLWNRRSLKRNRPVQALLSTHLLVIVSIPIVWRLCILVLDLIPRHFLRNLFDWLASLHLTMLWHFLLIALVIASALLLIQLIQHTLFNRRRLERRRLVRGACYACGKRLPDSQSAYCPLCSKPQLIHCQHCQALTPVAGDFCQQCGKASNRETATAD